MSVILQFNCLTHNETARKAMESYVGILQKAFEHYQNLWEDYIKLQEKYEQYNMHSSQVLVDTKPCAKPKEEPTYQQLISTNMQESDNIPLVELDTLNISSINFNLNTGTSDPSESQHKGTDENSPPKSPIFFRTSLKTGNNPAKKFMRSPKAVCNNSTSDMKTHHGIEKVSSKHNHKLEINTTHHVETTFLPDGKRLKQSRLAFYPIKSNEEAVLSSSVDKHKPANILHNVEQNSIEDVSTANVIVTAENSATNNTCEVFEDVIEISPTQRNITSRVKQRLKLKRKTSAKQTIKTFPSKNRCHNPDPPSAIPEITINDIDFRLCPLPKHTSTQMESDKFFINPAVNTSVNTLKDKINISDLSPIKIHNKTDVQIKKFIEAQKKDLTQNINDFAYEDETFYLPAEQAASRNDTDDFNLDDMENKLPEKKILPKRKTDISKQLNMRYKADRAKLSGWDCWECKEYYKNLSLSKEELQKRKNQCSRHRNKYERPNTPEGFWNPEFPETLSSTYRQNNS